jgi:hypothetical protein
MESLCCAGLAAVLFLVPAGSGSPADLRLRRPRLVAAGFSRLEELDLAHHAFLLELFA